VVARAYHGGVEYNPLDTYIGMPSPFDHRLTQPLFLVERSVDGGDHTYRLLDTVWGSRALAGRASKEVATTGSILAFDASGRVLEFRQHGGGNRIDWRASKRRDAPALHEVLFDELVQKGLDPGEPQFRSLHSLVEPFRLGSSTEGGVLGTVASNVLLGAAVAMGLALITVAYRTTHG
jgi:hypothetical protein